MATYSYYRGGPRFYSSYYFPQRGSYKKTFYRRSASSRKKRAKATVTATRKRMRKFVKGTGQKPTMDLKVLSSKLEKIRMDIQLGSCVDKSLKAELPLSFYGGGSHGNEQYFDLPRTGVFRVLIEEKKALEGHMQGLCVEMTVAHLGPCEVFFVCVRKPPLIGSPQCRRVEFVMGQIDTDELEDSSKCRMMDVRHHRVQLLSAGVFSKVARDDSLFGAPLIEKKQESSIIRNALDVTVNGRKLKLSTGRAAMSLNGKGDMKNKVMVKDNIRMYCPLNHHVQMALNDKGQYVCISDEILVFCGVRPLVEVGDADPKTGLLFGQVNDIRVTAYSRIK